MGRFSRYFKDVDDPRTGNAKRHDFHGIVMIAVLSSMCGGQTCVDMADFAANNEAFLRRFMALEHGIPSHDTFPGCSGCWPRSRSWRRRRLSRTGEKALEKGGGRRIADALERSPLHLAQAFATGAGIVIGQAKIDGKSNEPAAMPSLLDILVLAGRNRGGRRPAHPARYVGADRGEGRGLRPAGGAQPALAP